MRYAYVGIKTEDLTPVDREALRLRRPARRADRHRAAEQRRRRRPASRPGTASRSFRGLGVHVGGDAIVAIDGVPVADSEDVVRIVATRLYPGEVARFTVVRGTGARRVVKVSSASARLRVRNPRRSG